MKRLVSGFIVGALVVGGVAYATDAIPNFYYKQSAIHAARQWLGQIPGDYVAAPSCMTIVENYDADPEADLGVLNANCGRPTVIYAHYLGERAYNPGRPDWLNRFADAGYQVVVDDLGGDRWGDAVVCDRLRTLKSRFSPSSPVVFAAISMGGFAIQNCGPTLGVSRAVAIMPATNTTYPGIQPYLPAGTPNPTQAALPFPYTIVYGTADGVTGPPTVAGAVTISMSGVGHEVWAAWPLERVL